MSWYKITVFANDFDKPVLSYLEDDNGNIKNLKHLNSQSTKKFLNNFDGSPHKEKENFVDLSNEIPLRTHSPLMPKTDSKKSIKEVYHHHHNNNDVLILFIVILAVLLLITLLAR